MRPNLKKNWRSEVNISPVALKKSKKIKNEPSIGKTYERDQPHTTKGNREKKKNQLKLKTGLKKSVGVGKRGGPDLESWVWRGRDDSLRAITQGGEGMKKEAKK